MKIHATVTVYIRSYVNVPAPSSGGPAVWSVNNGGTYAGVYRNTGTNTLCVYWNNGGASLGCSATALTNGQWALVEMKIIGGTGTAGSVILYVNGTQVYTSG